MLLYLFICVSPAMAVSDEEAQEIMKGVSDSFSLPLRDLLEEPEEGGLDEFFQGLSGSFAWNYPFKDTELPGGEKKKDISFNANIRYNPITYWYFNASFFRHLDDDFKSRTDPDFTYSFGYDDWHPYTLSLVYSNFGANRFNPDRDKGEKCTRIEEGTINLGWKFTVPREIEEIFIVHPSGGIRGSLNYTAQPRYLDNETGRRKHWKQRGSLNLKYTIYEWFYISMSYFWYPCKSQKQPWDPDFIYGFGSFNWQPGSFNLQFNNYAGNSGGGNFFDQFKDAGLSGSWSWAW